MNRAGAPFSLRRSRSLLRDPRLLLSITDSIRRRRRGATRRPARHAGQPRSRRRDQRPLSPPRTLPGRQFALPPSHAARRNGHGRREFSDPLHPPGRGPTDACDILDTPPRQQPVPWSARLYGFSIYPEAHGARPSRCSMSLAKAAWRRRASCSASRQSRSAHASITAFRAKLVAGSANSPSSVV